MNILVLEDRGSVAFYMREKLESLGHVVLTAHNVNDAQSHWIRRGNIPIHCLVVDLNMPTEGLTLEQEKRAKGGLLTGWVWLTDVVFHEEPSMKLQIIIYSDYLSDLEASVPKEELAGMHLVGKRGTTGPADQVLAHISEIAGK